jgi:hypothetical protein
MNAPTFKPSSGSQVSSGEQYCAHCTYHRDYHKGTYLMCPTINDVAERNLQSKAEAASAQGVDFTHHHTEVQRQLRTDDPATVLVRALLDPEQFGHAVTPEVRDEARRVLGVQPVELPRLPVHYTVPTFLADVPAGAQLIAVKDKVIVAAPGMVPCYITPTGLQPIHCAEGANHG